jgi:hypothetical protein
MKTKYLLIITTIVTILLISACAKKDPFLGSWTLVEFTFSDAAREAVKADLIKSDYSEEMIAMYMEMFDGFMADIVYSDIQTEFLADGRGIMKSPALDLFDSEFEWTRNGNILVITGLSPLFSSDDEDEEYLLEEGDTVYTIVSDILTLKNNRNTKVFHRTKK